MRRYQTLYLAVFFAVAFAFCAVPFAQAASINFFAQPAIIATDELVTVRVSAASPVAINAVAATILYPAESLRLVSISRAGSIISYWIQEPATTIGSISFEGIIGESFTGANGKILDLVFSSKKTGSFPLTVTNAQILAADGYGTSVLADAGTGLVVVRGKGLVEGTQTPSASAVETTDTAPKISSITHPRERRWYASRTPIFEWSVPLGSRGSAYSVTKKAADPGTRITTTQNRVQLEPLADGTHFFNVRTQSAAGAWSEPGHYEFRVDSTPPEPFAVTFPHGEESLDPRPISLFNTKDAGSGIAYYEVLINDKEADRVEAAEIVGSNPYALPVQEPGEHLVVVRAFDAAGNITTARSVVQIGSLPPPVLHLFKDSIAVSEPIRLSGTTEPAGAVTVNVSIDGRIVLVGETTADANGQFSLAFEDTLPAGRYSLTARVLTVQGGRSAPSEPLVVFIGQGAAGKFSFAYRRFAPALFVAVLLILIIIHFFVERRRFAHMTTQIRSVVHGDLHSSANTPAQRIIAEIQILESAMESRPLTKEEHKILTELRLELSRGVRAGTLSESAKKESDEKL